VTSPIFKSTYPETLKRALYHHDERVKLLRG